MSEYHWSWIKRLKTKWHVWRAERLITKSKRTTKRYIELTNEIERHIKKARELLEEMKW